MNKQKPHQGVSFARSLNCKKRVYQRSRGSFLIANPTEAERSKADIRKWLEFFREEFGADPIAMFEERASRGEVNNWRKKWLHSPKQHDMAGTHATRVLNWAVEEPDHEMASRSADTSLD